MSDLPDPSLQPRLPVEELRDTLSRFNDVIPATPSLSGIPPELRVKIYESLLESVTVLQNPDVPTRSTGKSSTTNNALAVLQVCKKFSEEAWPLAEEAPITLYLHQPSHGGIARIDLPAPELDRVQNVVSLIQAEDFGRRRRNLNLVSTLRACPNLRSLELRGYLVPFPAARHLMRPVLRQRHPVYTLRPNATSIERFKTLFAFGYRRTGLLGEDTDATIRMPCVLVNHRGTPWMRCNGNQVVGVSSVIPQGRHLC